MGTSVLDEIREDLRDTELAGHIRECIRESVPLGTPTATAFFDQADWFAEHVASQASELAEHLNERGFTTFFAALERVRRSLEAASAVAFNAVAEREVHLVEGHRSPRAFLQGSVNLSNRERTERQQIAALVEFCPRAGDLLAEGTLPVGHAHALGQLVVNDRISRDELTAVMPAFLMTANLTPHDVYARRVRSWGRCHDQDGSPPDPDVTHRRRNVRLSNVLDMFVLEGRFGAVQGAKLEAILRAFEDIEFDRDWQAAKVIHGDDTCVAHLARTPQQRRADALEAIFLAAIGQGTAKDVEIIVNIVNIVTDATTFSQAAARAAGAAGAAQTAAPTDSDSSAGDYSCSPADDQPAIDDTTDGDDGGDTVPSPSAVTAQRRFCHTSDGVDIGPLYAVQAALDGYFRALLVGDDGVIINQGRKRRFFDGNARVAARLQAGLDQLHRCSSPGCRARPRHIDHATEWASPERGRTDLANANPDCGHHNLWKTKHGYRVRRDEYGNLRTYRPDGSELRPY